MSGRTRAVTITLRLVVPDDDFLDEALVLPGEPPVTMLEDLLDEIGSVLLAETLCVLQEELGDRVEAISQKHTIEAATDDSEDW